jgi:chemotaxis signal transduction protein
VRAPAPAPSPSIADSSRIERARKAGPAASASAAADRLATGLCVFWLGTQCFGLDVSIASEVVRVESFIPVALAPEPLVGLFNLRGTPVALVDLAAVLEIPGADAPAAKAGQAMSALVLKPSGILAAVVIDRMEVVLSKGRELMTTAAGSADKPFVKGFVRVEDRAGLVVTMLDSANVMERLEKLKYA